MTYFMKRSCLARFLQSPVMFCILLGSATSSQGQVLFFDDFENGLTQWASPGSVTLSTRFAFSGSNSQTFTQNGDGGDAFSSVFPVTPGGTYYLHVAYLTLGGGGYIGVDQFDASGNNVGEVWLIGDGAFPSLSVFDFSVNDQNLANLGIWKIYSQSYTVPAHVSFLRIKTEDWAGGLPNSPVEAGVYFDNIEWSTLASPSGAGFSVTTTPPRYIQLGTLLTVPLQARGGEGPLVWSLASGSLPTGLTLGTDGLLSGIRVEVGQFEFALRVIDTKGERAEAELAMEAVLVMPPPDIVLDLGGTTPVPGRKLSYFTFVQNRAGGDARNVIVHAVLEPWLTLDSAHPLPSHIGATTSGASFEASDGHTLVEWVLPDLPAGRGTVISYTAQLDSDVRVPDPVTQVSCARWDGSCGGSACVNDCFQTNFPGLPTSILGGVCSSILNTYCTCRCNGNPESQCRQVNYLPDFCPMSYTPSEGGSLGLLAAADSGSCVPPPSVCDDVPPQLEMERAFCR